MSYLERNSFARLIFPLPASGKYPAWEEGNVVKIVSEFRGSGDYPCVDVIRLSEPFSDQWVRGVLCDHLRPLRPLELLALQGVE